MYSTVKSSLKNVKEGTFTEKLARLLLNFLNTLPGSTGIFSAHAMFGYPLHMQLDLIRNTRIQTPEKEETHTSKFTEGTSV